MEPAQHRGASSWVIAGIILAVGLGAIAATAVPFLECPDCGGVVREIGVQVPGIVHPTTGCPRCRDGGRVTPLARLSGRRLHPLLTALLRETLIHDSKLQRFSEALSGLAPGCPSVTHGAARFVQDGDEHSILVLAKDVSFESDEPYAVRAFLFAPDGRLLDRWVGRSHGRLVAEFLIPPADGAVVQIKPLIVLGPRPRPKFHVLETDHAGRRMRFEWPTLCRLGIGGGRLELLPPPRD